MGVVRMYRCGYNNYYFSLLHLYSQNYRCTVACFQKQLLFCGPYRMDDNCGEWVDSVGVASGHS